MTLRIVLAGINYAPETTGIAPYTTGLAVGLQKLGHDVSVVTGVPHYPEWSVWPGYARVDTLDHTLDGVPVRRVGHYVPDPPGAVGRVRMEASFGARLAASISGQTTGTETATGPADMVLCVSPALLSTAMCLARLRMGRGPRPVLGVWVQDLYSRGVVETGAMSGRSAQLATRFEAAVLRAADGLVAIHQRFKARMVEDLDLREDRITVIRNWTHVEASGPIDRAQVRGRLGWADHEIVVLHAGNMGAKQGLENVIAAARMAADTGAPVRFVLMGDGNRRAQLEELGYGIPTLQFVRPLPEDEYRAALAAADVLLVNERPGVGEMAVPSKLTSYFSTGNPVLAATDAHSITAEEITTSGGGVVIAPDDPGALLVNALSLGGDTGRAQALGAAGRQFCAETLSSERAIGRFDEWVHSLVAAKGVGA